jgi:hypothetical protein
VCQFTIACHPSHRFIEQLGINVVINCGTNTQNPPAKPPQFRCKDVALVEQKESKESKQTISEILSLFDQAFDHLELARTDYERAGDSDLCEPEYRGPVDKYGRPVRSVEEEKIIAAGVKSKTDRTLLQPRVLMWSRLGLDRPCALVIAYMIRRWGMQLETAFDYVRGKRKGMSISPFFMEALKEWSKTHTLGEFYCEDCLANGLSKSDDNSTSGPTSMIIRPVHGKLEQEVINNPIISGFKSNFSTIFSFDINGQVRTSNLMEFKLNGVCLNNEQLIAFVNAINSVNLFPQLYLIDLSVNNIDCDGIAYMTNVINQAADVISPKTSNKKLSTNYMKLSVLNLNNNR